MPATTHSSDTAPSGHLLARIPAICSRFLAGSHTSRPNRRIQWLGIALLAGFPLAGVIPG